MQLTVLFEQGGFEIWTNLVILTKELLFLFSWLYEYSFHETLVKIKSVFHQELYIKNDCKRNCLQTAYA